MSFERDRWDETPRFPESIERLWGGFGKVLTTCWAVGTVGKLLWDLRGAIERESTTLAVGLAFVIAIIPVIFFSAERLDPRLRSRWAWYVSTISLVAWLAAMLWMAFTPDGGFIEVLALVSMSFYLLFALSILRARFVEFVRRGAPPATRGSETEARLT